MDERRRSERIPTSVPAHLHLARGRDVDVTISNVGELGALVTIHDLEVEVREGERALLEHPPFVDGIPGPGRVRTPAAVVRVDLDLAPQLAAEPAGIVRHVALYFDGGPKPAGVA